MKNSGRGRFGSSSMVTGNIALSSFATAAIGTTPYKAEQTKKTMPRLMSVSPCQCGIRPFPIRADSLYAMLADTFIKLESWLRQLVTKVGSKPSVRRAKPADQSSNSMVIEWNTGFRNSRNGCGNGSSHRSQSARVSAVCAASNGVAPRIHGSISCLSALVAIILPPHRRPNLLHFGYGLSKKRRTTASIAIHPNWNPEGLMLSVEPAIG